MCNLKLWLLSVLAFIACLTERGSGQQNNNTNATDGSNVTSPTTLKENGEYKLKKILFEDYDTEIRPVKEHAKPVKVKFEMALNQILEVDEKGESITLSIFNRIYWHDDYLKWNPRDYNNVKRTNVAPTSVWVPDITLVNSIDREGDVRGNFDQVTKRVIIGYDGNMTWLSNVLIMSKCPMNIRYFPFDTQECVLKFSSWVYDGAQLDLELNRIDVDLESFAKHTEWELKSAVHKKFEKYYSCCTYPYPEIHVTLKLKRIPLFYVLNLILPIVLIAFLTLLSFYVPSETGERISFGVTLLLAMTLFMLLLAGMIPAASDNISLMSVFFTCIISEMVCMIFLMCYISRMYLKTAEEGRIYPWMRKYIYEYLSFKLGIRNYKVDNSGKFTRKISYRLANGNVEEVEMEDDYVGTDGGTDGGVDGNKKTFESGPKTENGQVPNGHVSNGGNCQVPNGHVSNGVEHEEKEPVSNSSRTFRNMGKSVIKRNNQIAAESKSSNDTTNKENDSNSGGVADVGGVGGGKEKNIMGGGFDFADTVTQIMKQNNETLLEKAREEKEEKLWKHEWKICAMTMDCLALISFTVIFILITIGVLVQ